MFFVSMTSWRMRSCTATRSAADLRKRWRSAPLPLKAFTSANVAQSKFSTDRSKQCAFISILFIIRDIQRSLFEQPHFGDGHVNLSPAVPWHQRSREDGPRYLAEQSVCGLDPLLTLLRRTWQKIRTAQGSHLRPQQKPLPTYRFNEERTQFTARLPDRAPPVCVAHLVLANQG